MVRVVKYGAGRFSAFCSGAAVGSSYLKCCQICHPPKTAARPAATATILNPWPPMAGPRQARAFLFCSFGSPLNGADSSAESPKDRLQIRDEQLRSRIIARTVPVGKVGRLDRAKSDRRLDSLDQHGNNRFSEATRFPGFLGHPGALHRIL